MSPTSLAVLVIVTTSALLLALGNVSFELYFTSKYAEKHLVRTYACIAAEGGGAGGGRGRDICVRACGVRAQDDVHEEYGLLIDSLRDKIGSLQQEGCAPHVGTWVEPAGAAETYLQEQLRMVKTVGNFTGRKEGGAFEARECLLFCFALFVIFFFFWCRRPGLEASGAALLPRRLLAQADSPADADRHRWQVDSLHRRQFGQVHLARFLHGVGGESGAG